jgi:Mn2+/Fe2+ NRAMP family transporter
MPVRYFRFVDDEGSVSPFPQEGDSWSWRTFLSYAGPGFLVASMNLSSFSSDWLALVSYLDPGNLEADLQVDFEHPVRILT